MVGAQPHEFMLAKAHPLCFWSMADFVRWRDSKGARGENHCTDCLPAYQFRMKKSGRCEHPEVMFTIEDDGVVGHGQ